MPSDHDVELNILNLKDDILSPTSFQQPDTYSIRNAHTEPMLYDATTTTADNRPGRWPRWIEAFKRDPNNSVTPRGARDDAGFPMSGYGRQDSGVATSAGGYVKTNQFDLRAANYRTANSLLARELKGRHLQMIAIGGSIGTGLFVASGRALSVGGPASLLLAYLIIGVMLFCVMQALGELAVTFPVAGSFSAYSTRFLDPAWGFAMGWNYALQWLVVLPLEIIAGSITISFWTLHIDKSVFVTIFLALIIGINLCGVKGYGEAEFIFAIVKVVAVIGFILLGIIINIAGPQSGGYIGDTYWHNPGAFNNGFKGLCSVFITAAFAFAGTELVGLAAAETANPRKSLPTAIKQVFWRISLFYIVALSLVGLLVSSSDKRLLGATESDATASPFVIAIEDAGIAVLPSVMNAVILIAVISVGNSSVFGSSRTIAALADQGQAPRFLSYVDRRGRPLMAILVASAFGLLAYLADLKQQDTVLEWLLAISGLSSIFTWGSICLAHIRFRHAWRLRGRSLSELAFRAQAGIWGSYIGLLLNMLILVAQFWVGAWPVGYDDMTTADIVNNFFLAYSAAPVVVVMYLVYKLWKRTEWIAQRDIDVDTGRRDFNLHIVLALERRERKGWPRWKRMYRFFC